MYLIVRSYKIYATLSKPFAAAILKKMSNDFFHFYGLVYEDVLRLLSLILP